MSAAAHPVFRTTFTCPLCAVMFYTDPTHRPHAGSRRCQRGQFIKRQHDAGLVDIYDEYQWELARELHGWLLALGVTTQYIRRKAVVEECWAPVGQVALIRAVKPQPGSEESGLISFEWWRGLILGAVRVATRRPKLLLAVLTLAGPMDLFAFSQLAGVQEAARYAKEHLCPSCLGLGGVVLPAGRFQAPADRHKIRDCVYCANQGVLP